MVNDLKEKYQLAYRKQHSTGTALLRMLCDLLQSVDKKAMFFPCVTKSFKKVML